MTNEEKYKTPEERIEAFDRFCDAESSCDNCPLRKELAISRSRCAVRWLALEAAEKKEPMPCPFCGGVSVSSRWWISGFYYVQCVDCGSMTKNCYTKDEAVAAWNRRANND